VELGLGWIREYSPSRGAGRGDDRCDGNVDVLIPLVELNSFKYTCQTDPQQAVCHPAFFNGLKNVV